jgi:hypothetical protein
METYEKGCSPHFFIDINRILRYNTQMKITQRTEVYKKLTGQKWFLNPTAISHRLWLSCNDGMVPSGQEINDTTADELFSLTPIEKAPVLSS